MTLERTYQPEILARPFRPSSDAAAAADMSARRGGRKLAYLVNEYPKVSHSFIRREIVALERRGWDIVRISIRGWNAKLVDPADIAELQKTIFVLRHGALGLAFAVLKQMIRAPGRFFAALVLA